VAHRGDQRQRLRLLERLELVGDPDHAATLDEFG
jgi:hypothetical protein